MARLARIIVPDTPYHVTQRGNGRERTFFSDDDFALYRDLLGEACRDAKVGVWAWCLMPNHVHLILTPSDGDGLRRALARVHRRYAGVVNAVRRRTGHFWQGRFGAVAMDEDHLAAAFRYVSLNPVRARLAARAHDWRWSSARAHLAFGADGLTDIGPARARFAIFADLLETGRRRSRRPSTEGRKHRPPARICGVHRQARRHDQPPLATAEARAERTR